MNKSITWLKLWQRIGKQQLSKTRGKKVELLINGRRYEVALVFDHNGSEFHLEPTAIVKDLRKAEEYMQGAMALAEWLEYNSYLNWVGEGNDVNSMSAEEALSKWQKEVENES